MNLETDDDVKSQLLRKASQHRDELKVEVSELSARTEKVLTNALLVGGALALSYFVVRGITRKKSKRKAKARLKKVDYDKDDEVENEAPSVFSTMLGDIGTSIANQATAILIELAKEKLVEYLESRGQQNEDEDEDS